MDGTGYPDRLQGDQISLIARMTAICDVYDAITSDRPYKSGWDPSAHSPHGRVDQGHFDPRLFQAFVKASASTRWARSCGCHPAALAW